MLVTAKDILNKVCDVTGVSEKDIFSRAKLKKTSLARTLFWIALRMNGYTTEGISIMMNREHSTVARMTRRRYPEQCGLARQILSDLGGDIFEMMLRPQQFNKLTEEEKDNYSKLIGHSFNLCQLPIVERVKKKIVQKRVPDYKNSIIKTVWRIENADKET